MTRTYLLAGALAASVMAAPILAQAQGTVPGAAAGAASGAAAGGAAAGAPGAVVGGVVGGAVGAATGTVGGILGVDTRPRFRTYVQGRNVPSYAYREDLRVGAVLPQSGVTYYEIPAEYGPNTSRYRYTVVNNRPVIVDPGTHRVIEIVE